MTDAAAPAVEKRAEEPAPLAGAHRPAALPKVHRVAIVVVSKHADLLNLHLEAHELYTPADVPVVVVDTSDEGEEEVADLVLAEDWNREVLYLDCRGGLVQRPGVAGGGEPVPGFYGNFVNAGVRFAADGFETFGGPPAPGGSDDKPSSAPAHGRPEYVVLANDDTVPGPLWLETMLADFEALRKDQAQKVGILGARSNYVAGPQSVFDRTLLPYGITGEKVFPYPKLVTFFAMVRLEDFERVGGFDEDLPAHNYSDDLLSIRFMKCGMSLKGEGYLNWVSRAFVFHAGSRTFARLGDPERVQAFYQEDMKRGEKYLLEKHPDAPMLFGAVLTKWFFGLPGADPAQE